MRRIIQRHCIQDDVDSGDLVVITSGTLIKSDRYNYATFYQRKKHITEAILVNLAHRAGDTIFSTLPKDVMQYMTQMYLIEVTPVTVGYVYTTERFLMMGHETFVETVKHEGFNAMASLNSFSVSIFL